MYVYIYICEYVQTRKYKQKLCAWKAKGSFSSFIKNDRRLTLQSSHSGVLARVSKRGMTPNLRTHNLNVKLLTVDQKKNNQILRDKKIQVGKQMTQN